MNLQKRIMSLLQPPILRVNIRRTREVNARYCIEIPLISHKEIRAYREKLGMSESEFGKMLGIETKAIIELETPPQLPLYRTRRLKTKASTNRRKRWEVTTSAKRRRIL